MSFVYRARISLMPQVSGRTTQFDRAKSPRRRKRPCYLATRVPPFARKMAMSALSGLWMTASVCRRSTRPNRSQTATSAHPTKGGTYGPV